MLLVQECTLDRIRKEEELTVSLGALRCLGLDGDEPMGFISSGRRQNVRVVMRVHVARVVGGRLRHLKRVL